MCGRFTLRTPAAELAQMFALLDLAELVPRYNIAPTQPVLTVREQDSQRTHALTRWGLVPFWAKDLKIGARMINARAETVATKPAFRAAWKKRRCLIPVDGFYEWQRTGRSKTKQPWLMEMTEGRAFAFAGLWESWGAKDADATERVETCTVITTTPNSVLEDLHDRMPVIIQETDFAEWLSPASDLNELDRLLVPSPPEDMTRRAVNPIVNNARNEVPEGVQSADDQQSLF